MAWRGGSGAHQGELLQDSNVSQSVRAREATAELSKVQCYLLVSRVLLQCSPEKTDRYQIGYIL